MLQKAGLCKGFPFLKVKRSKSDVTPCTGSAMSLWKSVGYLAGGTADPSPGVWETLPDTGEVWEVVQREGYQIPVQLPGFRAGQLGGGGRQVARGGGETRLEALAAEADPLTCPSPVFTLLSRDIKLFEGPGWSLVLSAWLSRLVSNQWISTKEQCSKEGVRAANTETTTPF